MNPESIMGKILPLVLCAGLIFLFGRTLSASEVEKINALLHQDWQQANLTPVPQADDATFLRRARLDLTGRAPTLEEIQQFSQDTSPDKRSKLIIKLLDTEEYADLMAMRYADVFRVKSEFPINLWPNAVQLYHRYLRDAALHDKPFRELAHEMLTASGSNFRVAPANYFRASADRTPGGLAKVTAMTWLGLRLEKMPAETTENMSSFFRCIGKKSTAEWKEEIIFTETDGGVISAVAPDGTKFSINTAQSDPREVFANWLLEDHALQFSKAWVNRAWHWLFGTPLCGTQPDDMPIPDGWSGETTSQTPPLNDAILTTLAQDFHNNGGKMKTLLETICLCDAYLTDWKTKPEEQELAEKHLAVYPVHRIEAEIIVDLLADITGHHETYHSVIPEPFTILPKGTRAIQITDGSISSATLDCFGKPPRDNGTTAERNNAVTGSQRLYLMNSGILYRDLEKVAKNTLKKKNNEKPEELVNKCFLMTLSRNATPEELQAIREYREALPKNKRNTLTLDVLWSLVNTKEFLFHH